MSDNFITKDSGARQQFETGSVRDLATGKGRFDLIPSLCLRRLAALYERGAAKYGDNNWQKGQPLQRYLDSALRHLNELRAGEVTEDHAISVVWNMFAYIWTLAEIGVGRLPASLDDRPPPEATYAPTPPPYKDARVDGARTLDVLNPSLRGPERLNKVQREAARIEPCDVPDCWCQGTEAKRG